MAQASGSDECQASNEKLLEQLKVADGKIKDLEAQAAEKIDKLGKKVSVLEKVKKELEGSLKTAGDVVKDNQVLLGAKKKLEEELESLKQHVGKLEEKRHDLEETVKKGAEKGIKELEKKLEDSLAETRVLKVAKQEVEDQLEAFKKKLGQEAQAKSEEFKAAKETAMDHAKKLTEKLEADLKKAKADAGAAVKKAKAALDQKGHFEKKISSLQKELSVVEPLNREIRLLKEKLDSAGASSSSKVAEKKVKDLEKKLEEEKKRHDAEIMRIRQESDFASQPLYLIAFVRGKERYLELSEKVQTYFEKDFRPQSESALKMFKQKLSEVEELAAPHLSKVYEATTPLRAKLEEEFEKVRPQYEAKVKPQVDEARKAFDKFKVKAETQGRKFYKKTQKQMRVFRLRAISVLQKNENLQPHAEKLIDSVLISILAIVVMLTFMPTVRFLYTIVKNILYYGLCCCCCCGRRASKKEVVVSKKATPKNAGGKKKNRSI